MRYLVSARVKPGRESALACAIDEKTLGRGSVAGVIYPALESVADELHIRQPDMFYLAALNKPLFDLEILLARRGMFQCSNKSPTVFRASITARRIAI
jgi:hypothetical protein